MGTSYVDALIADVNLVIGYASRAGVSLPLSIYDARDEVMKTQGSDTSSSCSRLEISLAEAVREIAPLTILHLRSGQDPLSLQQVENKSTLTPRRVLILSAALLVTLIISFTSLVHRQETALKAVQQTENTQFDKKFRSVVRKLDGGQIGDRTTAEFAAFQEEVAELVRMEAQRAAATGLADRVSTSAWMPIRVAIDSVTKSFRNLLWDAPPTSAAPPRSPVGVTPPEGLPNNETFFNTPELAGKFQRKDPCYLPTDVQKPTISGTPAYEWVPVLTTVKALNECISSQLNIYPAQVTYESFVYRTNDSISLFYSWILPLLYGALGAVVFLMRNLNNVRTPNLHMSDTLFRIAMGAIAGIVIGWFFNPSSSSAPTGSATPFGIAFLAGFSIDLLFAILDRAIGAAKDFLAKS
jgi:hypothetical protein